MTTPAQRRVFRRRRFIVFGSVLTVLLATGYVAGTVLVPVPAIAATVTASASLTQPAAAPAWPGFGGSALGAVGFDGVLGSSGDQAAAPIASITKVITALVVLDAKPLTGEEAGPNITFTQKDVDLYYQAIAENGSVVPVSNGLVLSQRETLEAVLIPSGNNYSVSLALWAYGSVDAYLTAAEAWLADEGLDDTVVADTSGLSPASRSSPADLVDLAKLALANPAISSIVNLKSAVLPSIGTISNSNKLLGTNGVDGIKTGTTDEAGACLLFSADILVGTETITLVGVVLNGDDHGALNIAIARLIASVQPGFHEVTLSSAGTSYGSYTTAWGETSNVVTAEDTTALVWSDTPIEADATTETVTVGAAGTTVGDVTFTIGSATRSVPLVLESALHDPGPAWRLVHPGVL
jgi:D-alanyl-D-alanine carboxypeptidase (penicillin-binding protein 5/6)